MKPKGFRNVPGMRAARRRRAAALVADNADPFASPSASASGLGRAGAAYLEWLAVRGYAQGTRESAREALNWFAAWCEECGLAEPGDITRPVLEAYQRRLWRHRKADGSPLGGSTQRQRLSVLRGWFSWLVKRHWIAANPAADLELPRPQRRLPGDALTPDQVAALLALPDIADPLGLRDRAMLELLYASGLRRAELARLEVDDFRPAHQVLAVRQGKGSRDRVTPTGARAAHWLARYLEQARPLLAAGPAERALFLTGFGHAWTPETLGQHISRLLKASGLERRGGAHLLRHTCATHMLEGGADIRFIQQQLGHAKLETTALYAEVCVRQLLEVHARCHPGARLPAEAGLVPSEETGKVDA